ncbi:D-aminoacyl-tRNA deacylase [Halorubrum vacuolatum]|uniref:D-aminoacyl-tRNA deacylase n=1 Tax=Halorubrum vacuolatum TaxID=63740 RepID=A0A238ULI7_HALVU|nr:D-aminoacyl-tRNA deacylase [Halorubrum vacuolatum]SNR22831.1 D-aminoacyl-tRNA deacylase [Halorubrum vacuolatum]
MIAIVVSRADEASEHIGERLLEAGSWTEHEDLDRPEEVGGGTYYRTRGFELRTFEELHIYLDDPSVAFDDPALLVFVSRHRGETGPLLTAHVTGNFGPAEYGGDPGALAHAPPGAEKRVVEALAEHAPDGYDVGIECTHHGPTDVTVPSMFVELGSGESEWADPAGARAVARAVLELGGDREVQDGNKHGARENPYEHVPADLRGEDDVPRHIVGFGGGHYAPRFTRIVRETEWAVGHVAADWALAEMGPPGENAALVARAFERSNAELAVIEGDRPALAATVEDLGYRVVSETWIREVEDRPQRLIATLEAELTAVDEGLRFGDVVPPAHGTDPIEGLRVRTLPGDLLARAQGIDATATRAAVERHTVAFETEQAGTRAAGRAVFLATEAGGGEDGWSDPMRALIVDLATVLEDRYERVEVDFEGGVVVARESAFDPTLAAERGVPEGPAFGRLSAGESVVVDGEPIEPDAVTRESVDRFPIG